MQKQSSGLLQVIELFSPNGTYDQLFLSNYATINIVDEIKRINGVGDASLFGALDYSMRVWLDPARLTNFQLAPLDVANAIQAQNVQAAVGRIGAAPLNPDQQFQFTISHPGPAHQRGGVRAHHRPRQPGRLGRAGAGRRARRARRPDLGPVQPLQRPARRRDRRLSGAGANAVAVAEAVTGPDGRSSPSGSRATSSMW